MVDPEATARHEAGHVVAAYLRGRKPLFATIIPDEHGNAGRVVFPDMTPYEPQYFDKSEEKQQRVAGSVFETLAGSVGHDQLEPERAHDLADACDFQTARRITQTVSWQDQNQYFDEALASARLRLALNKKMLEVVAQALSERQTLTGDELFDICDQASNF